ncbi:MAG: FAD-dependent monooxygenase [Gemmatimonadaceae bacterium]
MTGPPVLIVGAGPTGLALALWLNRFGVAVRIIDKTSAPGTTSRALGVQARTLEFYRQVGLADDVVAAGVEAAGANLWTRSRRAARVSFRGMGEGLTPYPFVLMYAQDVHERLLIARLTSRGVSVERQTELLRFDQDDGGVRAVLRGADGSEERCDASYIAGCDGAHSTVRQTVGAGFPGSTYSGLFYVADVDATGPAANGEIHLELESADFLALFPLKGTGHLRLIGPVSWDHDGGQRDVTFDDIRERTIENLKLTVSSVNWFSTYRVHHRVAARFRDGRAFLLGDAAHVHSPVGGQGMNTGIGDAVNLAWKLAAVLKGSAPESLLATYDQERRRFALRLVATTDRAFTVVIKQGPLARWVRTRVVPRLLPLLFRTPPLRRFLFRTLAQLNLNYRDSALSVGMAGAVRGGDRLPWVYIDRETDNFAPLATLSWQVHVYGEPRSDLMQTCAELGLRIHPFPWRPEMARAGLRRDAVYLIRPDGHVALADPDARPERLRQYLHATGIRAVTA